MTVQTHIPPNFTGRVLAALKAPSSYENVRLFDAWIRCEGGTAKWNPLNTSLSLGSQWTDPVDYNSIPVRNYRYETAGVVATVLTFIQREQDGRIRFGGIMGDLQQSRKTAEQIVQDHRAEFEHWGTDVDLLLRVLAETAATDAAATTRRALAGTPPMGEFADGRSYEGEGRGDDTGGEST